jgi:hypothetical protein
MSNYVTAVSASLIIAISVLGLSARAFVLAGPRGMNWIKFPQAASSTGQDDAPLGTSIITMVPGQAAFNIERRDGKVLLSVLVDNGRGLSWALRLEEAQAIGQALVDSSK